MKNLLIAIMMLALMLSPAASADLFPSLNGTNSAVSEAAPSYGGMAGVDASSVTPYAEGGVVVRYDSVDNEGYKRFDQYLEGFGFEVEAMEKDDSGRKVQMKLTNGTYNIGMVYDADTQVLQLIYEENVDYEKPDLFSGYTTCRSESEFSVPGVGTMTFHDLVTNTSAIMCGYVEDYHDGKGFHTYDAQGNGGYETINCYLTFSLRNTTANTLNYSEAENDLFQATLVYINTEGHYTFDEIGHGRYYPDDHMLCTAANPIDSEYRYCDDPPCESLADLEGGVAFGLPESIEISSQDTVVILLDFVNGERYVLML